MSVASRWGVFGALGCFGENGRAHGDSVGEGRAEIVRRLPAFGGGEKSGNGEA